MHLCEMMFANCLYLEKTRNKKDLSPLLPVETRVIVGIGEMICDRVIFIIPLKIPCVVPLLCSTYNIFM